MSGKTDRVLSRTFSRFGMLLKIRRKRYFSPLRPPSRRSSERKTCQVGGKGGTRVARSRTPIAHVLVRFGSLCYILYFSCICMLPRAYRVFLFFFFVFPTFAVVVVLLLCSGSLCCIDQEPDIDSLSSRAGDKLEIKLAILGAVRFSPVPFDFPICFSFAFGKRCARL